MSHTYTLRPSQQSRQANVNSWRADRDTEIALRGMIERHAPRHTPPQVLHLAQDYAVNLYRGRYGLNAAVDAALGYLEAQSLVTAESAAIDMVSLLEGDDLDQTFLELWQWLHGDDFPENLT